MLDSQLMDEKVSTHHDENLALHINESQVILAYRYFTHAIITANYFMLHHEASSENQEMISKKFKTKERIKSASKKAKRKIEKKKKATVEPVNLNGLWGEITSQVKLANATRSQEFKKKVLYLLDAMDNFVNCLESLPETHAFHEEREAAEGLRMDNKPFASSDPFNEVNCREPLDEILSQSATS